jgi:hypothetical protein
LPSTRRLTTLVRASRASSGGSSIIGAIAAAGVLREGRNAVNYVREGESRGEAGLRGRGDEVLLVEIWARRDKRSRRGIR